MFGNAVRSHYRCSDRAKELVENLSGAALNVVPVVVIEIAALCGGWVYVVHDLLNVVQVVEVSAVCALGTVQNARGRAS